MTMFINGRMISEAVLLRAKVAEDYFRARGEDPTLIAPDFFLYHANEGKTPAEMYRIACNRRES